MSFALNCPFIVYVGQQRVVKQLAQFSMTLLAQAFVQWELYLPFSPSVSIKVTVHSQVYAATETQASQDCDHGQSKFGHYAGKNRYNYKCLHTFT